MFVDIGYLHATIFVAQYHSGGIRILYCQPLEGCSGRDFDKVLTDMVYEQILQENKIDINSLNTHTSKQGVASLDLSFVVSGRDELNHVVEKLRQIPGVLDIERTTG